MAYEFKIGASVAELAPLQWYGIPLPISCTYHPWTMRKKTGGGNYRGYGFPRATWEWSRMQSDTLWEIMNMFDTITDASQSIYICTYKDSGVRIEYADFSAIMMRPLDGGGKSMFPRSLQRGAVNYTNVSMVFEHLVEVP